MRDQGFGPDLHAGRQGTSWNSYRFALAYEGRFAPEAALAGCRRLLVFAQLKEGCEAN
jgi:hypothetical protein